MLNKGLQKWLETNIKGVIKFDEPMKRHTSFKVGGPADVFVTPEDEKELIKIVTWVWEHDFPYLIVGDGTNLLVKDNGIRGVVISLTKGLKNIQVQKEDKIKKGFVSVGVEAGCRMQKFCRFAINKGLKGMNFALGIPGTIGGAIIMNAGTSYGAIGDVIESVSLLFPPGDVKKVTRKRLEFSYRSMKLKDRICEDSIKYPVVLNGILSLGIGDPCNLKKEADDILNIRKKNQPTAAPSAGCFFKNPKTGKTAGDLIDMAGLKGKSVGGAKISEKHGNFIINQNRATASDILSLRDIVQETVLNLFDINLEPEVHIVG